jgi:hypothetical protein
MLVVDSDAALRIQVLYMEVYCTSREKYLEVAVGGKHRQRNLGGTCKDLHYP